MEWKDAISKQNKDAPSQTSKALERIKTVSRKAYAVSIPSKENGK